MRSDEFDEQIEQGVQGGHTSSRGTNQSGVKLYNERLVLSLIRSGGSLSKVDVARISGLSVQTTTVIMNQLESDGLLLRGEPQRGRIGQPSVPMQLNPEGAFSIGAKIGRRTAEIVLMDFVGAVRQIRKTSYAHAEPEDILGFFSDSVEAITGGMTRHQFSRICGVGIAAPTEIWHWGEETGTPPHIVDAWREFDLQQAAEQAFDWPVHIYNDATAACASELTFGGGRAFQDFFYIFSAALVGGGLVLDGSLYPGRRGFAGAIGSLPVPPKGAGRDHGWLLQHASVARLERMIRDEGDAAIARWQGEDRWSTLGAVLDRWIEEASDSLAYAVASVVSVIDFEAVVIDGAFPAEIRRRIVADTAEKFTRLNPSGVAPVEIREGSIGSDARVMGAASLPLLAEYARDRNILFN